ncbi:DoxX family protein [Marinobacter sp. OP 3.4]|uniref:DoxX family protein n=1 Tax=Marinobacter sp. OP 3.4 TaxID=3076501 RepID=UPI002E1EF9D2
MFDRLTADTAALVLRWALGLVLLAHSLYLKMMVFTLAGTAEFFVSVGLPGPLAYIVFLVEMVSGAALILGWHSRLWAVVVMPVLLGATWVHLGNGWLFTNNGGGWEYPLFLSAMAGVQACLGDGRYSLTAWQSMAGGREVHP